MKDHRAKIFIIGAGAIGKALAVFLRLAGRDVELTRGSISTGGSKIQLIRVELPDGTIQEAEIPVTTLDEHPSLDGTVVLTSKSFGNEQLAARLRDKAGLSPVVLLQNGLGVEQPFIQHGFLQIYRCVLFVTSQLMDETIVRFKPVATCPVGIIKGEPDLTQSIVELLATSSFSFSAKPGINTVVWKKAITNCIFNSICPLLDVDNGIFQRNTEALGIARTMIAECITIAKANGVSLNAAEVEQTLLQISKSSDGQLISTLQDIRNHRRTEIDTLNFAVAEIARRLNKTNAVPITTLLGQLTKIKADLNMQNA